MIVLPEAAVLAGGFGTRIRAVAGDTPKVLLPVENRPFLAHILEYLRDQGVERVVLCLGFQADRIWDVAMSHAPEGLEIVASREEEPLGTGGAVRLARAKLGARFFLLNGDTFVESSLFSLHDLHAVTDAALTLSLVRSEQAAEKGTVRIAPDGTVLEFAEKTTQGTGLINAGVYEIEASVLDRGPGEGPCSLERDIIPAALDAGDRVMALRVEAPFVDIGLPDEYLRVRDRLPRAGGWA